MLADLRDEPERPRPVLDFEPAAERRAEVDAAFAPERAPVAAAFVARRAPDAALRAVLRAELRDDEDDLRELLRELLLPLVVERVLRERDEAARLRLDVERRRPDCARWSRGISFLTRSLTSCGISFSRYRAVFSSSRRMSRASFAVSLSPTSVASVSIVV